MFLPENCKFVVTSLEGYFDIIETLMIMIEDKQQFIMVNFHIYIHILLRKFMASISDLPITFSERLTFINVHYHSLTFAEREGINLRSSLYDCMIF